MPTKPQRSTEVGAEVLTDRIGLTKPIKNIALRTRPHRRRRLIPYPLLHPCPWHGCSHQLSPMHWQENREESPAAESKPSIPADPRRRIRKVPLRPGLSNGRVQ